MWSGRGSVPDARLLVEVEDTPAPPFDVLLEGPNNRGKTMDLAAMGHSRVARCSPIIGNVLQHDQGHVVCGIDGHTLTYAGYVEGFIRAGTNLGHFFAEKTGWKRD
eukprot:TRINITY_DN5669_c0_g1_i1.p6 TRINITY_DN5669_c0_g1~~TRINITY_DN5669_c0_g1_i1.p6  ORF type:complete len:106 (-),score=2.06 TRINITY_DN5669_c0_g1_i1:1369-1686(-)